jgi:hypothetical protein
MRISLLLLVLCPLYVSAQYRPIYSPTARPTYSAPVRTYTPTPYQQQQAQQQQAHQNFQRTQAQQAQSQQFYNNQRQNSLRQQQMQQQVLMRHPLAPEQLEKQQVHQQEAEAQATAYLARFAQDLRDQRLAKPAADAQQAAAQQQEDVRQLTIATVKAYREVFLPGQMSAVMQARALSPKGQANWQAVHKDLLDQAWWGQPDAAQVNAQLAAHARTLATLTTDLLGFDVASPPPAPAVLSVSALDAQLAADGFDRATANQLMRDAAQAEKRLEGARLAQAVQAFTVLTAQPPTQDLKARQKDVKKSLSAVDKELQRYYAHAGSSRRLFQTQQAIMASTAKYLAKNKKQAS